MSPAFLAVGPGAANGESRGRVLRPSPRGPQGGSHIPETGGFPQTAGSVVGAWHSASAPSIGSIMAPLESSCPPPTCGHGHAKRSCANTVEVEMGFK